MLLFACIIIIFRFVEQLETRFSEINHDLFKIFHIFDYTDSNFLNPHYTYLQFFIEHYRHFQINNTKIISEFKSIKALLKHKLISQPSIEMIVDVLVELPNAFSETLTIMHIILTLPISTASNERFFSSLKRVKSYLRSSMGDDRTSDLMIINVEKEDANTIDLNNAVDKFAMLKNRRYPLI